jgi:hypothetical protein
MQVTDTDDLDLDTDNGTTGNDGNAAKTLRAQNSKLAKQLEEANTRIAGLEAAKKTADLSDLIARLGVDEKYRARAAKYAGRDLEDVTEESVRNWLKAEGDMFGWTEDAASGDDSTPDPRADQQRRIAQATSTTPSAPSGFLTTKMLSSLSDEDLIARGFFPKF